MQHVIYAAKFFTTFSKCIQLQGATLGDPLNRHACVSLKLKRRVKRYVRRGNVPREMTAEESWAGWNIMESSRRDECAASWWRQPPAGRRIAVNFVKCCPMQMARASALHSRQPVNCSVQWSGICSPSPNIFLPGNRHRGHLPTWLAVGFDL